MTPKELGYRFPAEWHKHKATWLSYPHNENSWPGKIETIFDSYNLFIKELSLREQVCINVLSDKMQQKLISQLKTLGCNMQNVYFFPFKTNDAWARDHGPAFIINEKEKKKAILNWKYNAWGGKYPSELDNLIPSQIAKESDLEMFNIDMVLEGGSVDFNGKGTILTTTSCLLNPNRNPEFSQQEIETKLCENYGANNVLWLGEGIVGDDTDGHIDDIARFINEDTVICAVEENHSDENYTPLKENIALLNKARLENGKQINIVELLMPEAVFYEEQRLPASYANFYIANDCVIVPVFKNKNDDRAIYTLEDCFKDRTVIGIDASDIIWGLGSFHCLSQQEPFI